MHRHIKNWFKQHAHAFFFSLGQYIKNPINNILTTFVIGISLAFPTGFYVFLNNIQILSSGWEESIEINLFLDAAINEQEANIIANRLSKRNDVSEIILIKKDAALAEYKKLSGFSDALDVLDENPFPNVILVKQVLKDTNEYKTKKLISELETMTEVDNIQYDNTWVKRLIRILDIIKIVIYIISTLLAISLGAVFMGAMTYIGNAPNFMVKSIAEENKINMPSFFGFMFWSICILVPVLIVFSLIYF